MKKSKNYEPNPIAEMLDAKRGDEVCHPPAYNQGKIEVIEFIEDQKLDFHLGNVIKYVCRAGKKDPKKEVQDLEKGVWYLKRKIELLKAKQEWREPVRPNDMNKPKPVIGPKVDLRALTEAEKQILAPFFNFVGADLCKRKKR